MGVFLKRQNDIYWKTIKYVQTNIKAWVGIGEPIHIRFYADINKDHPNAKTNYYNPALKDEDCMFTNPEKYCLLTCYRICEYLQQNYGYDIFQSTFVKDDDGKIWLFEITNLITKFHE
jgi:hypothetical protein